MPPGDRGTASGGSRQPAGWPLPPSTPDQEPEDHDGPDPDGPDPDGPDKDDAFGQALARAAARRSTGSASDDWLTATDEVPPTKSRRAVADSPPQEGWLTSADEPAEEAGPSRSRRVATDSTSTGDWPTPPGEAATTRRRKPDKPVGEAEPARPRRPGGPGADESAKTANPLEPLRRQLAQLPAPANTRRRTDAKAEKAEKTEDPVVKAKDACLSLLTVRARTRSELDQALRRKGFEDDVITQVLSRLDEVGLIDDAAFADSWVQSRHTYQGLGRRALKAELHRKGVPDDVAAEAVASVDRDAEEQRARELVRKRLKAMTGLDDTVKVRRLLGMLARKGYSQGLAYSVIKDELRAAAELLE